VFNLHNQDHGVADQDADQCQNAEDRNESERRSAGEQSQDDADQGKRRDRENQK